MVSLHNVTSVTHDIDPGVLIVDLEFTDDYGNRSSLTYAYRADDPFGLSPLIGKWLETHEGEYAIQPYVPPPPLSDDERRAAMPNVSARQLRLTLVRNGFPLSSIDATIAALPEGQQKDEALIEWEYAHEFQRVSPTLNSIAAALGITSEQVDVMWSQALAA